MDMLTLQMLNQQNPLLKGRLMSHPNPQLLMDLNYLRLIQQKASRVYLTKVLLSLSPEDVMEQADNLLGEVKNTNPRLLSQGVELERVFTQECWSIAMGLRSLACVHLMV